MGKPRKISGVPTCPHCGASVLSMAIVENYYPIEKITTTEDRKGYALEIGDLDEAYERSSQFICSDETGKCGKLLTLEELIITSEEKARNVRIDQIPDYDNFCAEQCRRDNEEMMGNCDELDDGE